MKRKIIISGVVALFMSPIANVSAQEAWTLDSCLNYAVLHNISIRQQQLRIDEGNLSVTDAKDRFLPSLDASASQSLSFGRGLTAQNTYENRNTSSTSWGVNLGLPLFQGTQAINRVKIARLSLQQCVLECEAAKDNLRLNVISQYLQVLYAKEVAAAAEVQEKYSAFEVERQKALVDAGKVAEATLYDIESVAAQDRLQTVTSRNDVTTALVTLANLLQLPSPDGFDVAPLDNASLSLPDAEPIFRRAMETNYGIMSARQSVKVAEGNVSLAKAAYIPTLSFSAGLSSSYYTMGGMKSESFGSQMRHNFSQYLGFSLRIPIFDGFNTRNGIRRAKVQKTNAELALDQQSENLKKEIQLAYCQAAGALKRYETSAETLKAAKLSFESVTERFNLGRATQADYEQSKNNLFKTEVARIQARYEYLIRHRILEFYAHL